MSTYALDCAFDSSATAYHSPGSIAMSYGFAAESSGSWTGKGQRPEGSRTGDQIYFSVFDMAGSATSATVTVTFATAHNAQPNQGASPLSASDTQTLAAGVALSLASNNASTGCNVYGTGGALGPYTIANAGNFAISVSVSANGKSFGIDPELEVTRGSGPEVP